MQQRINPYVAWVSIGGDYCYMAHSQPGPELCAHVRPLLHRLNWLT